MFCTIVKNRSAIPRGSDRKTSGGGKFPLEKLSAQRKRKRTEDRIGWAMSGVKHDPSLFGKLTPRTKAKADVYRSRFFSARAYGNREQHGWSHRAWLCPKSRVASASSDKQNKMRKATLGVSFTID